MVKNTLVGIAIASLLSACSKAPDCGVADTIAELGQTQVAQSHYYLYSRTTGMSDKARFYELYDQKPVFDACGHADQKALSDAYIDPALGNPARVIVRGTRLEVEYASGDGAKGATSLEIVVQ